MIESCNDRHTDAARGSHAPRPRVCGATLTLLSCMWLIAGCAPEAATDSSMAIDAAPAARDTKLAKAALPEAASGPSSASVILTAATADGSVTASIGTVRFENSDFGLLVVPDLKNLQAGPHAAHIHANPDCSVGTDGGIAGAAGDHYDPNMTGVHAGPYGDGHLGDLPNLIVEADGTVRLPALAPRLTASDVVGRSLMIHAGADRYDAHAAHDHGKGGARMYCGVIN